MNRLKLKKLVNNKDITFDQITILCDETKILNYYLDLCVHTFKTKKIYLVKNVNQLNMKTVNLVDSNKVNELENCKLNLSKYFIYIPLRNCYLDFIRYKKKLKKIKYLNYELMFSNNFYVKKCHYTNNLKLNLDNKIHFKNIVGLSFKNKLKYFYPYLFTLISILKNLKLTKNFIFDYNLVFCGKIYHNVNRKNSC